MTASEQIWAEMPDIFDNMGLWYTSDPGNLTEYVLAPVWHRMDDAENPPPKDGARHLLGFGNGAKFSRCQFVMVAGALGWLEAFSRNPAFPTHWRHLDAPPAPAEGGE